MTRRNLETLVAPDRRFIHLIGGGGKTTLMYQLAWSIVEAGGTVLSTTTTRILTPTADQSPCLLLGSPSPAAIKAALTACRHVTLARDRDSEGPKLVGHSPEFLDRLHELHLADAIIVEADGSAGRPLKAYKEHEPVIASKADAIVVLIGADAIGQPLSGETVHRPELFSGRFGLALRTHLDPGVVAEVVAEDYLVKIPAGIHVTVILNRVSSKEAMSRALAVADLLRRDDRINRILVGDLIAGTLEIVS
jgi:probable selenium-dependent hydroxylase accessory protein YqeC